jgi:hypothetical protein
MISELVGDMFDMPCIHTCHDHTYAPPCEVPTGATLPLLERDGMRWLILKRSGVSFPTATYESTLHRMMVHFSELVELVHF